MVKQQQNIVDGGFKSTPVHIDGIAKGKSQRNEGNFKEKSQGKSKEKLSNSYNEKNADQKCQRCLGKLHLKKTCPSHFSKCNKCSKSVIGHRLVKVQNQEKYLKLLKRKNRSFQEKSWTLVKSKATPQSHHGLQPFLWTRNQLTSSLIVVQM